MVIGVRRRQDASSLLLVFVCWYRFRASRHLSSYRLLQASIDWSQVPFFFPKPFTLSSAYLVLDDGKENYQCLAKIFLTEFKKRHLFSRYLSKSHEVEADDFISNELNSDLDYNYFSHYNPCWYSDAAGFSNQVH